MAARSTYDPKLPLALLEIASRFRQIVLPSRRSSDGKLSSELLETPSNSLLLSLATGQSYAPLHLNSILYSLGYIVLGESTTIKGGILIIASCRDLTEVERLPGH